ncbi:MAG: DNA methyltransferase [Promethearchaeota archaeon]
MLRWKNKSSGNNNVTGLDFEINEIISPVFLTNLENKKHSEFIRIKSFDESSFTDFKFQKKRGKIDNFIRRPNNLFQNYLESNFDLLFLGDNKDALAYLKKKGFNGKIDLIFIDPPFKTDNAFFFKEIDIRHNDESSKKSHVIKQRQYKDKWELEEYLQFLYERLILLRDLMKDSGSIYVHLDEKVSHYIKLMMDEIFGRENFRREITWNTASLNVAGFKGQIKNNWIYGAEKILFYTKTDNYTFNTQYNPRSKEFIRKKYKLKDKGGHYRITRRNNKIYLKDDRGEPIINVWNDILSFNYAKIASSESVFYPTQKPEKLLERIILASSNPKDIILDCFIGSGTTAAMGQKLNRRWIGCDMNPVAIHTTSKRIQRIIHDQNIENNNHRKNEIHQSKFLIYTQNSVSEKIIKNKQSQIFNFSIKFDKGVLKVKITEINKSQILKNLETSEKEKKNKILLQKLKITDLSELEAISFIDSLFLDISAKKNGFFRVLFSDIPRKRKERILGEYILDLKTFKIDENCYIKLKIVDIFGKSYTRSKKLFNHL